MNRNKFILNCLRVYLQRFIDLHFMITHRDYQKFRRKVMESWGFRLYLTKQHIVYLIRKLKKKKDG